MADSEPQFDPVAFAWLHAKAEQNQLTEEEIAELREQIEAFQGAVSGIFESLIDPITGMGKVIKDFVYVMNGYDPRVAEIHKNHRKKHDHGDTTPQCRECGLYLSAEEGHNRTVCPRCGKPNTFYWEE